MKKLRIALFAAVLSLLASTGSTAITAKAESGLTLKVYNWADYIYEQESETDPESVIAQFEAYASLKYSQPVTVSYSTFETNEIMYNQVAGLGSSFDLICPSDYMIQKMAREGLLEKIDHSAVPNYTQYASPYIIDRLKSIPVGTDNLNDYTIGYMWDTMGLTYNPAVVDAEDVKSWSVLWNPDYYKLASVKDSMRDTYLVALAYTYKSELESLKATYEASAQTPADSKAYNDAISIVLNRRDADTLEKVAESLKALKKNYYGLEVDSGKSDIVTGKVQINLAWSGDAVYSMDVAETENAKILNYSIPEEGSNIWFDGWVMPKSSTNHALAADFVDFLSNPDIACLNMDYIGYTSFIAGDKVLTRVNDLFSAPATAETVDVDLSYFFDGTLTDPLTSAVITTDNIGRQFSAQYPDLDTIRRCVVMQDFGTDNNAVVEMWSNFKATTMSVGAYIAIGIGVVVAISVGLYFFLRNKKSQRHIRQKARSAKK